MPYDLSIITYRPSRSFLRWDSVKHIELPFVPRWSFIDRPKEPKSTVLYKSEQEKYAFLKYNYIKYRICQYRCFKRLTAKHHEAISFLWKEMMDMEEDLVNANMGLVIKFQTSFVERLIESRFTKASMQAEKDELKAAGMEALLRAVRGFDVSKGLKFSTYASNCVIRGMSRWASEYYKYANRNSSYIDNTDIGPKAFHEEFDSIDDETMKLEALRHVLDNNTAELSRRELSILRAFWFAEQKITLKDYGKTIDRTRERVRQIKLEIVEKLKIAMRVALENQREEVSAQGESISA